MTTTIEEILNAPYARSSDGVFFPRTTEYQRRGRPAHQAASTLPAVVSEPLEATKFRLHQYKTLAVFDQKRIVKEPIPMDDESRTVQLFWEPPVGTLPSRLERVVVCVSYTRDRDTTALARQYLDHGVRPSQLVVVGNFRPMPMEEYAALADAGVFLKHIRYDQASDWRVRAERELRLVYGGLLGTKRAVVCAPNPDTYTFPPDRITREELADRLARLQGNDSDRTD